MTTRTTLSLTEVLGRHRDEWDKTVAAVHAARAPTHTHVVFCAWRGDVDGYGIRVVSASDPRAFVIGAHPTCDVRVPGARENHALLVLWPDGFIDVRDLAGAGIGRMHEIVGGVRCESAARFAVGDADFVVASIAPGSAMGSPRDLLRAERTWHEWPHVAADDEARVLGLRRPILARSFTLKASAGALEGGVVIGRGASCFVRTAFANRGCVAGVHAYLFARGHGPIVVVDCGSASGVAIVRGGEVRRRLGQGQRVAALAAREAVGVDDAVLNVCVTPSAFHAAKAKSA